MRDAIARRGGDSSLGDALDDVADPRPSVVEDVERAELGERVRASLRFFAPGQHRVVELRFGLEDGRERTMLEVAGLVGLSKQRIGQVEAKALTRLRNLLGLEVGAASA